MGTARDRDTASSVNRGTATCSQAWADADLALLLANLRVVAAADVAWERGLGPAETGSFIANAFPELCDDAALAANSILPMRDFFRLEEAAKVDLLRAARKRITDRDGSSLRATLRTAWTADDLRRLLAIPRVIATIDAGHRYDLVSMREFMWRAFPEVYPDGHWRGILPVAGLDDLSGNAMAGLLQAAGEAFRRGEILVPPDLEARFPDAYAVRPER